MRVETKEVKTKGNIVGSVDVNVYETIDELVEAVEEKTILDMFNKSNVIAAQATERQKHTPGRIGKGIIQKAAFNLLTTDEVMSCAGDFDALNVLIEGKIDEAKDSLATAEDENVPVEAIA